MTDYTKSTGSSGTMMIRDTGTWVEFWLKAGSTTFNHQLPWAYVINGVTSSWREFDFKSGGSWQKLSSWLVDDSQTVTFKIGDSGTSGLGGPTTFSASISRAKLPSPPSAVTLSNVTATNVYGTFTDGANGGSAIDDRQIGYGTSTTTVQHIVSSDRSTTIVGLVPGTVYYFWARTHNSVGWSGWGPRSSARTLTVPDAPTMPVLSNITPISVTAKTSPNWNGGAAITKYQFGWGPSSTAPANTVETVSTTANISGLTPGTKYYFWARAWNSQGWSNWSAASSNVTSPGARINVNGVWKNAVPYVKVDGVWRMARPYGRVSGVWKETK